MRDVFRRFRRNEAGATAIEYVLLAAIICIGLIGVVTATGDGLSDKWDGLNEKICDATENC